ncbi:ATP/GTP-binding protein [Sphingobacterium hungaricum]
MKRIVISGTYCTGKTTLSIALSLATGIPTTHALIMREILPVLFPTKTLRQCSYAQLLCLGMKRFEERIRSESQFSSGFISDGCTLQEWLYGSTRIYTGVYPDEYPWKLWIKRNLHFKSYRNFKLLLRSFEGMAKSYAKTHYDLFVHLPVEFPFVPDNHRPTSERFREHSEMQLVQTYQELGIKPLVVSGTLIQRLEKLVSYLHIDPILPLPLAIAQAEEIRTLNFDQIPLENT